MISINYSPRDVFTLYGMNHFIEKFGIPVEINKPSASGIVVSNSITTDGDFSISLTENEIRNHFCGKLSTQTENIFLSENPRDTGTGDDVIAYFDNGTSRYPCVTQTKNHIAFGFDIFKETSYILSGHLDSFCPSLNQSIRKDLASKPMVDFLENLLFDSVLAGCHRLKVPLVQKSYWPDGKQFAVCLTHDIDEIKKTSQWISRPIRCLIRKDSQGFKCQIQSFTQKIRGREPYYTYDDIIGIEKDIGAKSTYFILKESGHASPFFRKTWYLYGRNRSFGIPEMRKLIQRLKKNGDEVAVHGSFFSYRDPILLKDETRELEKIIDEKVIGTRQHNLNLEVPETWEYQASAGLQYDTTLGFRDMIGFRWGTSFPFFPNTRDGPLSLLEIPLIIMDICLESSKDKLSDCRKIADEVNRYHGVLTLLWHPPIFNTLEYPDARDIYIKVNQYCQKKKAWFARAKDIYDWYSIRKRNNFSFCYNPTTKICTIVPDSSADNNFYTIYLPPDSDCIIHSENADIIKRDEGRVHIKTNTLENYDKVILGIT